MKAWILMSMLFTVVNARADVSWTGVTQSPGDYTSSGIVTITGSVTLNPGTYTFATLVVNSSRTLTLLSDTTAGTGVIINATTVTINGTVTGDGKGYTGTQGGTGKGNIDGTSAGGGCHGGFGGVDYVYELCVPYGDPTAPTTLGSPGGMQSSSGSGGGAVKFDVSGTMTVAGTITMNGTDSSAAGVKGGGGAGGSVWIKAATLTGAGTIRANGSNSLNSKGPGAGGRVLISYATSTFTGTATANGGTGSPYMQGTEGSTFWVDYINNDLLIKNNSTISNGTYNFRNVTINNSVWLWNDMHGSRGGLGTGKGSTTGSYGSGAGYGGRGAYAGIVGGGTYGNMLEPTDQGSGGGVGGGVGGIGGGAIKFVLTGTLTVNGTLTSSGTEGWYDYDYDFPGGGSGGSIWIIADSIAGTGAIGAMGGWGALDGSSNPVGGAGSGGRIAVYYTTSFASTVGFDVSYGSEGWADGATVGSAVVINSTTNELKFPTTSTIQNGTYTYSNVTLSANAIVTAIDGNGPNTGTGKGTSSTSGGGGGGYGGAGGAGSGGAGGAAYGSSTAPVDMGSGGGGCGTNGIAGTAGGNIKFIISDTLTVNSGAALSASGAKQINDGYCGGGSGGSIWISAKNINSITNGIIAKGGNGDTRGGGGGGGRIAIYCTGSYAGTLSVAGGTGKNAGATGSTLVKCSSPAWFFRGY
ncbi:hypothetical protein ACLSU7_15450 [Bdellovibrio sp. HCB185ZH]|uniref:hypothetical protein n=1 Tax=Bdellovibrio sp. HCB185ZH TaxID=3394235 RepID=UPI0039A63FCD